jgi:phi LC3 family holin
MLNIDLKARLKNKTFWVSIIGAILLLSQQLGLDASRFIPKNYVDIINTVFSILAMVGIVVDTSTPGISDSNISNTTVHAIKDITSKEEVKTKSDLSSEDNTVTGDSQSSADISKTASNKKSAANVNLDTPSNMQVNLDNSASSKIVVDNPDNTQQIGAIVNSTSASVPN